MRYALLTSTSSYPPKFSSVPATIFTPKKGSMKAYSTLSLTNFPWLTTLITPYMTPKNFLCPPRPYLPLCRAITPSSSNDPNDPPNDLVTIIMRLAGYARLAQACVSGESGGSENYFINEKFCLPTTILCLQLKLKFKWQTQWSWSQLPLYNLSNAILHFT